MQPMKDRLENYLKTQWHDCERISIENFADIPGGYSKETFRFDALIERGGQRQIQEFVLRKDRPKELSIQQTSLLNEHILLRRLREHTTVKAPEPCIIESSSEAFGQPVIINKWVAGDTSTRTLFSDPSKADEADSIARDLCEQLAQLHQCDSRLLNSDGRFNDPRAADISLGSWDHYMDSMINYMLNNYSNINYDSLPVYYDAYLHLRRNKPRPLPLVFLHGEVNSTNMVYKNGKVAALIDWENAHIGDPREDLSWLRHMDAMTGTNFFHCVRYPGGFLGYYNHLTGQDITIEEIDYFQVFTFSYITIPVFSATKNRIHKKLLEVIPMYLTQAVVFGTMTLSQLIGYMPRPTGQQG